MKKPQAAGSVDPEVFLRLKEYAEADERSLAQIVEESINNGIGFVEKRLKEAGRLPKTKKPMAKSAKDNLSTIMTRQDYPLAV